LSIRKKTLILIGTALSVFIAVLTITSYYVVTERFEQIEKKDVTSHVLSVRHALNSILENLESISADWAPWDDTYQFIEDQNPGYIERNLVDSTFTNLRLNFMLFYNNDDTAVCHRFVDLTPDSPAINPDEIFASIAKHPALFAHASPQSRISGILMGHSCTYLIAAHPIVTSNFEGPIRGTLVLGRMLDTAEIENISSVTRTPLKIYPWKASGFNGTADRILSLPEEGVLTEPLTNDTIAGYSIITDLTGVPALILETTQDREFYRQGLLTWQHNATAMLVFGLVFIILLMFLLDHTILNRLGDLTRQVGAISFSGGEPDLIEVTKNDEIGRLTHSINSMLESIYRYHTRQIDAERFLRQLLDSINCGVMVVDREELRIVDVNATGAELFERQRHDIIGKVCHRLVCPNDMGNCPVTDQHQRIDLSERSLLKPDGSALPILKSVATIERNGRPFIVESFIDISSLQKAQADLRKSEERYRRFFEEDITGDALISVDGRIIDCNPAFARMFGYDHTDEILQVNMKDFHPSRNRRRILLDRLQKENILENLELEFVHRSKRPLYCIGNLVGHFDHHGNLEQISSYLFDDTKRVLLEKNLRQAHKMEAIGTLAGGIAHDFNNILSGIMGYTEISLLQLEATEKTARNLNQVMKAAHRAKELVQQILTFSRQDETENRPVKVSPIVDEVYNLMRASLPTTIDIGKEIAFNATVMADPVQIHQVIMNLCTNAGHAMKDTGGRLSITIAKALLDRGFADHHPDVTPGTYACLSVEDTGKGIPEEFIDRIFDPFFSTKGKTQGTGLGLSVVHGIVTKLGGTICVSSSPAGTRFDVYLPTMEESHEGPLQDAVPVPKGSERIVLIDDEDFQVDIGTQMLEAFGYTVTGFTSSFKALEYITSNTHDVDLVITDMTMPHMTGTSLAAQLMKTLPHLPIIVCTGYSEQLTPEKALAMGFRAFVMKPVVMKDLARTIREVLSPA
jgi:two-component system cell cycle sensor histidine kinase/response regulator CckA